MDKTLPESSGKGEGSSARKYRPATKATRRIRGEIACAECRRLKVRCDRMIPCSTCTKRGCAALCPNEIIPPGDGSRFVTAATNHLMQKITKLEARMRSLEDALAIGHGSESEHPHPLLNSSIEISDEDMEGPTFSGVPEPESETSAEVTEAFGTLFLDSQGGHRFFGPSGGSESLLQSTEPRATTHTLEILDPSYLPPEINCCYQAFPFTPPNVIPSAVQPSIRALLPSLEKAIFLCDTFLEHLSWMCSIVSRHQLMGLIQVIYQRVSGTYGPHDLSLLLIVLGIGSLLDLSLPPYNLEGQLYHHLARACMVLQPLLGAQSIITIKVLHLMSIYYGMSGNESNLELCYTLLDLGGQMARKIGFHIDPSAWGFNGREAYERRVYFWNLVAGVFWQSLLTGRPPGLSLDYIDCRIPTIDDENLFQEGEVPIGFGIWGFKASRECLIPMNRAILATKAPSYETIMELDAKIRNLAVPTQDAFTTQSERTAISMRTYVRSHYQELMLMFLHRAHFAESMTENPENPLHGPYSQSVYAAYSSACVVLRDTRQQFSKNPLLCARIWMVWSFAFTAAIIVGTVAVRGAHLCLKPPPLEELESIIEVFVSAAETNNRAARALPILKAMLTKARKADRYFREKGGPMPLKTTGVDELRYLGAKTNVVKEGENSATISALQSPVLRSNSTREGIPTAAQAAQQPAGSFAPYTRAGPSQVADPSRFLHEQPAVARQAEHPSSQRPVQTFADLCGGWTGMLHDVPSHHYTPPGGNPSSAGSSSMSRQTAFGFVPSGVPSSSQRDFFPVQTHTAPPNRRSESSRSLMLDDRWASYMNFGVLGDDTTHSP